MYIEHWDAFYEQAVALYRANPLKTRFVTKYRHCDGKLTLKVTDGPTCLQYKTDQASDLRKLERLNAQFFALMATGEALPEDAEMQPADKQQTAAAAGQQQQQQQRQKKTRKG
ncbi:Signal recognition particle 9 kDa [Micractinium conductrix]|uniref:Signal recognition particle 9 kDa protein n=1 Tax=Micractinium conductrix TaxID=554055 RepID=A0A2P6VFH1_9CHLO|nr:Signal recognition particle 9 kDa [Micractinium conductrix]|eukprot:PSC72821.1 Signal recognition particle 9 kDa [Micractinium conductrix]